MTERDDRVIGLKGLFAVWPPLSPVTFGFRAPGVIIMAIDRKKFFDSVRASLFNGVLSQRQVDGMNYLLDVWEKLFADKDIRWLAYALATAFHETAYLMSPLEEYGKGSGQPYGQPTGPHHETYYGRGHVQLTWEDNYKKGEKFLEAATQAVVRFLDEFSKWDFQSSIGVTRLTIRKSN